MAELVFNCVLGIALVAYLIFALKLPATDNPVDVLGAGGFPIIVGVIGLLVLSLITIQHLRSRGGEKTRILMFDLASVDGRAIFLNIVLLAAYIFLLDILGFALGTLLYLPAAAVAMGYRKWLKMALFSMILTSVIVLAFGKGFFVPLPRGVGFLRELSYLIY